VSDFDGEYPIEIEGLRNCFGDQVIHDDLSLKVKRGEILGVVGGSGTGKSVLMRSIIGLQIPDAGEVRVFGKNTVGAEPDEEASVRSRWGVLFQGGALFSMLTVAENVEVPLKQFYPELEPELLHEIARYKVKMSGLPEDAVSKFPSELSGGMRKRAGLARMLLYGAETALLDEPFAALDAQLKLAMHDLMLRLVSENRQTVVLVTHDLMEAVTLADRVLVCTRRPATIAMEQRIDLARPRDVLNVRFSNAFKQHYDALWERLRLEYHEDRV